MGVSLRVWLFRGSQTPSLHYISGPATAALPIHYAIQLLQAYPCHKLLIASIPSHAKDLFHQGIFCKPLQVSATNHWIKGALAQL